MHKDLTNGEPIKIILFFTIPIVLGNVFQQLYNMADTIIVGQFVGANALAAVGLDGTIMFLIIGFLQGLTAGVTVSSAQLYGAQNYKRFRKSVGNSAMLTFLISVFLTIISMIGMHPLLELMNTPVEIFNDAYNYMMIICGGILFQALFNYISSILRAIGNSKVPLYFLILSAFLNIVLDLVFIIYFSLGTAGAALATVISQGIAGMLCLIYCYKCIPLLKLSLKEYRLYKDLTRLQLKVGFPMGFQYSITAIGTIVVQACLNTFGATMVASFSAASKIDQIFTQLYVGLGTAIATYCAQNMGAYKIERIKKGFRSGMIIGSIYALVLLPILFFYGKYFTILFLSENIDQIMPNVATYLQCISVFMIPLTAVNVYRNGLQGMGLGFLPMLAGIFELVGRSATAIIAKSMHSYIGICLASPMAWILADLLLLSVYFATMKKLSKSQ